jgi:hypothetical protein
LRCRQRVRARPLEHRQRDRGIEIEIRIRRIVDRRQFDLGDVAEPHHGRLGLFDDDVAEFVDVGETALRLDRDLEGARPVDRRLIEHARRDLHVLPHQRQRHVDSGHAERFQPLRIEPDPHRIVAATEHRDRSDAVDAGERVLDLERREIGNEQRVARTVRRIKMHHHHQVGRALAHRDADVAHVGGQARRRGGDAVLHLHLRDIEIGAEVEGDGNAEASVSGRVRRHVEHVLDAVDLLLDRSDHGRGDHLRAGAGILAGDVDDRRAISGYCAIGRRKNETAPEITNVIETTQAKIGRSMKKCDKRIRAPSLRYFVAVALACA